jgi:hypothetical protein
MNFVLSSLGARLASYLSKPSGRYELHSRIAEDELLETLQPCDLLLVEGNSRISAAIKYLTQSTWSHVAIYIGHNISYNGNELKPLLEVDLLNGVQTVPLNRYEDSNIRICRPINLSEDDKKKIIEFTFARIGYRYDTKNIFDLMRYLLPTPPVPARYRRQLIAFGSGDPTKAICSTLVAQAYQSVHYPILPRSEREIKGDTETKSDMVFLKQRHYSHFTPRDFDLSPYFEIVKPTVENNFNYKQLRWCSESSEELLQDSPEIKPCD